MVEIVNPQDAVRAGGDDLLARAEKASAVCGPCDLGLMLTACVCGGEDPRAVIVPLLDALAAAREELAEAKREEERYRQEARDSARTAGKALRELREARQDVEYWKGKYEAAAMDALADDDPVIPSQGRVVGHGVLRINRDVAAVPGDGEQATTVRAALGDNWSQLLNDDGEQLKRTPPISGEDFDAVFGTDVPASKGDGEQAATTSHGWTSHGYACCGQAKTGERPNSRARCMGNPRCAKCKADAEQIHTTLPTSGQA